MADRYGAIKALLKADATLTALVSATYILDDDDVGRDGLKLDNLKSASTPVISPAIYLHWTTDSPMVTVINAVESFLEVYYYQNSGYGTIESARRRVWDLLHQKRVTLTGTQDYIYALVWAGDVLRQKDDSLGGASMERSRYQVHWIRR